MDNKDICSLIKLKKVNFLIGEDGTGKTGFIKCILYSGGGIKKICALDSSEISFPYFTAMKYLIYRNPETYLHPKSQAEIGDYIFDLARTTYKNIIVETHSDYLIDRFRKNLRDKEHSIDSQSILFQKKSGQLHLDYIEISHDGVYSDNQPKEFREFFIQEALDTLNI